MQLILINSPRFRNTSYVILEVKGLRGFSLRYIDEHLKRGVVFFSNDKNALQLLSMQYADFILQLRPLSADSFKLF